MNEEEGATVSAASALGKPAPWPKDAVDQVRAVADLLATSVVPLPVDDICDHFIARGA